MNINLTPPEGVDDDGLPLSSSEYPNDAWDLLSPRLTGARQARLLRAAEQRTRHIRLVVQDIHHPHNISACLRSAEAFGVQDVDVVTMKEGFKASTVAKGVTHWLTLRRHYSIPECVKSLRSQGYRIVAGIPRSDAVSLFDLPLQQPLAVVFGNEHAGISAEWLDHIDHPFTIPMVGLVESLNISVCAAITLAHLTHAARQALPPHRYHLPENQRRNLLNQWVCRTLPAWQHELQRLRPAE